MRVLYIGGTGEISYECVLRSVEVGHEVTVFNRGSSDEPLGESVRQITGDMTSPADYGALRDERFDVVCQFIAFKPTDVERDLKVFGGACGQYVFISSASVYRKPPTGFVKTEDTPLGNPFWEYSSDKVDMERFLTGCHADAELPVTIVRPAHTYRRISPFQFVTGDDWAWRILNDRPIIIHGDGTSLWTYTHSRDFAVPFVGLLGNAKALGEAFHITRHMDAYTWDQIAAQMARSLGKDPDIVHVPTDTLIRYNEAWGGPLLGDFAWSSVYDNSKVMSVAGEFECTVSLAEGLDGVVEHYRKRPDKPVPDEGLHALLDRVISDQRSLGRQ